MIITLKNEYWTDFAELITEVYEKDTPVITILAQTIQEAVRKNFTGETTDIELDWEDCEYAREIAADIEDYYYAIYPKAVHVATAFGCKLNKSKISIRKKHLNVITVRFDSTETTILQLLCKDCMVKYAPEKFAYVAASEIGQILDSVDVGESCVITTHHRYFDPLFGAIDKYLNDIDTPRKKRIYLQQIRTRLSTISYRIAITAISLRRNSANINMSDTDKIDLAKKELEDFITDK